MNKRQEDKGKKPEKRREKGENQKRNERVAAGPSDGTPEGFVSTRRLAQRLCSQPPFAPCVPVVPAFISTRTNSLVSDSKTQHACPGDQKPCQCVGVSTPRHLRQPAVRDFSLPPPTACPVRASHGLTTWSAQGPGQSRNSSGPHSIYASGRCPHRPAP